MPRKKIAKAKSAAVRGRYVSLPGDDLETILLRMFQRRMGKEPPALNAALSGAAADPPSSRALDGMAKRLEYLCEAAECNNKRLIQLGDRIFGQNAGGDASGSTEPQSQLAVIGGFLDRLAAALSFGGDQIARLETL